MKVSWCDDLDCPELGVVMDLDWLEKNKQPLIEWLREHNGSLCSTLIFLPDNMRLVFALRWL